MLFFFFAFFFLYYIAAKLDLSLHLQKRGKSQVAPRERQCFLKGGWVWIHRGQNDFFCSAALLLI